MSEPQPKWDGNKMCRLLLAIIDVHGLKPSKWAEVTETVGFKVTAKAAELKFKDIRKRALKDLIEDPTYEEPKTPGSRKRGAPGAPQESPSPTKRTTRQGMKDFVATGVSVGLDLDTGNNLTPGTDLATDDLPAADDGMPAFETLSMRPVESESSAAADQTPNQE